MPGPLEYWTVCCDHPGCVRAVAASAPYDELAVRRVLEQARADGWRVGSATTPDLCPPHAALPEHEVLS